MDLFNLPEVVLQGFLLPYLEWKDLLSLRTVCKAGKQVVQRYLKVYSNLAPEIEIRTRDDEQGRNLEAFLAMGVYSSKIHLNNPSGAGFYENNEDGAIRRFLEEHGGKVKHLRVKYWNLYCTGNERQFLEALVNLKSFQAMNFTMMTAWRDELESEDIVPKAFRNLGILKLNQPLDMDMPEVIANANKLLTSCPNLQLLSLPCFESLELRISCDGTMAAGEEDKIDAKTWFNFRLSHNTVQNETLASHRLHFTTTCFGVPDLDSLVGSCSNLKILKISNWIGTNEQLARLWRALGGVPLEEIVFENCRKLADAAFIGDDRNQPVFLGLAGNLKRLTLNGLDQMPGITDTLFRRVIRRLSLTHFIITSNLPVRSITESGIFSLTRSRFTDTIERFPFVGWTMENVSLKRFQKLGSYFRIHRLTIMGRKFIFNERLWV